jgi:hypothetical protein
MDVVRARCPARIADPSNLEQPAARVLGSLPEHGAQPGDGVDEFVACSGHVLSSFAAFRFDLSLCNRLLLDSASAGIAHR